MYHSSGPESPQARYRPHWLDMLELIALSGLIAWGAYQNWHNPAMVVMNGGAAMLVLTAVCLTLMNRG